jgi:hypothetical protein
MIVTRKKIVEILPLPHQGGENIELARSESRKVFGTMLIGFRGDL